MPFLSNWIMRDLLTPLLRPATRFLVGCIAIPLLRLARTKVLRQKDWDDELERDVEQWFRASLVLLFATKNMELLFSSWLAVKFEFNTNHWFILAGRLLLAIGVVESMPDQQLFSIIHPGPPKLVWRKHQTVYQNVRTQAGPYIRGMLCRHINRSSPVFAILCVIFGGIEGWIFYLVAIAQYLFIGLVTSRDRAINVLSAFDRRVAQQRKNLIREFNLSEADEAAEGVSAPPAESGTLPSRH